MSQISPNVDPSHSRAFFSPGLLDLAHLRHAAGEEGEVLSRRWAERFQLQAVAKMAKEIFAPLACMFTVMGKLSARALPVVERIFGLRFDHSRHGRGFVQLIVQ